MALIFTDGFDSYGDNVGGNTTPANVLARRNWIQSNDVFHSEAGRVNGGGLSFYASTNLYRAVSGSETTKTFGFAFKFVHPDALNGFIVKLGDGGTVQMSLRLNGSGYFEVYRGDESTLLGTSTYQVVLDRWVYVELETTIDNTGGAFDLHINGVSTDSDTAIDTQESGNTYWNRITLENDSGSFYPFHIDDFYIADTTGSYNTGFLGAIHIETIYPDSDVTDQWALSAGSDAYAMVDETPVDDDTTYMEDNVTGQRELFDFPALESGSGTILGVTSVVDIRVTDASPVDLKFVNVSNVTTTVGAAQAVSSTSYAKFEEILEENPDASAVWTVATLEAAQFGFEVG